MADRDSAHARREKVRAAEAEERRKASADPQEIIDEHMRAVAHRVMDVFENAHDEALAEEIQPAIYEAIGLQEAFGNPTPSKENPHA